MLTLLSSLLASTVIVLSCIAPDISHNQYSSDLILIRSHPEIIDWGQYYCTTDKNGMITSHLQNWNINCDLSMKEFTILSNYGPKFRFTPCSTKNYDGPNTTEVPNINTTWIPTNVGWQDSQSKTVYIYGNRMTGTFNIIRLTQ